MSFISTQTLPSLLCAKCKKYLSHFPIHESLKLRGPTCGRCPIDENAQRNLVYEELTKSKHFPCCFDSNGCTETLFPCNIPEHEIYCYFRKYNCPSSSSTNCDWQGFASQLQDHFEKNHRIFVLQPEGFEVDFITNYDENCLLTCKEDLFIVNRTNHPKTETISYNVSYIGTNRRTQKYFYKVVLQCVNDKSSAYIIENNLTAKTNISRDFVLKILNNPKTVFAQIEIKKPEENLQEYSEVNTSLLRELECSDCFEYMLPPIQQCIVGHSICSICKAKHSKCPTCAAEFNDTINITLGHLIEHLIYPCRNEGCKFTCKAMDIKKHEENCVFGLFKCPLREYENCEAELNYVKIYDHILDKHYENLLEMDIICMPFEFHEEDTDENCYILMYDCHVFKLHYLYKDGTFFWEMQVIGVKEKTAQYKFEIDVIDNSGDNCRVQYRASCSSLSDKTKAFVDNKCFISLEYQQIEKLITEVFSYRVRIYLGPE